MEHPVQHPAEYRVELPVYNGPLDLLLYLIKRDELDIYDIPISRIMESYLGYVNLLRNLHDHEGLDINVAGDFVVMAATLMEIKSAMLLPKAPVEEKAGGDTRTATQELTDPRAELVQKLLEYKKFRDSATLLEKCQSEHENRFARYPARPQAADSDEPPPVDLEEVQVWDLLSAFDRLMKEVGPGLKKSRFHEVTYDDTPVELHAADIEDRLRREGKLTLRALIVGRHSRSEVIGVFLAVLELIRQKKILVKQDEQDLNDLEIDPAPPEHRRTYHEETLKIPGEEDEGEDESVGAAEAPPTDEAVIS